MMQIFAGLLMAIVAASACATTTSPASRPIPPTPPSFVEGSPLPVLVQGVAERRANDVIAEAREWRPRDTTIIAVVSDLNPSYGKTIYGPHVTGAARWIVDELKPDVVLSTGDMVAGQKSGLDYDAMWRGFDRAFYDILQGAEYTLWVTPGNHDGAAGNRFQEERTTYRQIWETRRPDRELVEGSNWPFYYAFEQNGVLFVGLDVTTVGPLEPSQHAWLKRTLRSHPEVRATVVFGHVPPLPFAVGREWEVLSHPELESDFEEYGVDVVVSGHHHAYYPGRRGSVRYIGAAPLGSGPRPLIGQTNDSPRGVTVVTVRGDGTIHVEAHIAPEFTQTVDHGDLPPHLDHAGRRLERLEVSGDRAANDDAAQPGR